MALLFRFIIFNNTYGCGDTFYIVHRSLVRKGFQLFLINNFKLFKLNIFLFFFSEIIHQ